jgi:hypothetical protein
MALDRLTEQYVVETEETLARVAAFDALGSSVEWRNESDRAQMIVLALCGLTRAVLAVAAAIAAGKE